MLKLLTGLYYPQARGQIMLDNQTITYENYQSYRELFSAINKTVIAVSHDDRYFDAADRVITMEEGHMKEIRK
ncbi:hypothetical protein MHK_006630 [Candidatus Magnetomorum sp. HK-1]|nr:hypothetical protein MHK_006630 [Candidatus Magnetomorum sp. HK-1]